MSSPFDEIERRLSRAQADAPDGVVGLELPEVFLGGLPAGLKDFAYRAEPVRGSRALALAEAWREEAVGVDRLGRLREALEARGGSAAPLWFAAPFEQDHPARVWLPAVQLEAAHGRCRLWVAGCRWRAPLGTLLGALSEAPESTPYPQILCRQGQRPGYVRWRRRAETALAEIARGGFHKVVLARELVVRGQRPFDPARLARVLECRFPSLHQIALDLGGEQLLAATPEYLLSLSGDALHCEALAGTAARDPDPARDERLGRALLDNPKIRHEHRWVVEALREVLAPRCALLEFPDAPRLMRLRGLQHLCTPIEGRLHTRVHPLDLVAALHPSPAVAGWPREAALDWLRAHEGLERGWYSGLFGRLGAADEASIDVVLRTIRISGTEARLNAGAGLVAGSDPGAEWEETELKLSGLIEALAEA